MKPKLKLCPFCGGEARLKHIPNLSKNFWYFGCNTIGCNGRGKDIDWDEVAVGDIQARERWNRRSK